MILQIYADYNKRLGAYKITYVLQRDYGINISVGRVYRLMRTLQLPRMSTEKPFRNYRHKSNGECTNHLHQEFNQRCPNIVWVSVFTYIRVAGKWYYLCIVMDLFSRKVIAWNISAKPDVDLVMTAFKKLMRKGTVLKCLCSILIEDLNILLLHSGSYWILLMSCNHSQKKVIPSIMLAVNVSSNTSKKKKLTGELITLCKSYSCPYLNILKDSTTQEGLTALLEC